MSIDYSKMAFPKPAKRKKAAVRRTRDGREVLNTKTAAGKREYKARLVHAWTEQKGRCYLCGKPITLEAATPEHVNPKGHGGGSHDDRQSNIKAACWPCNRDKGSKRLPCLKQAI